MNLVVDKVIMHFTPQSNGWHLCVQAETADSSATKRVADQSGDDLEIPLGLVLTDEAPGAVCTVKVFLDDSYNAVCSNAEDRSKASFTADVNGSKVCSFKGKGAGNWYSPTEPNDDDAEWSYTLYWHLE